MFHSVLQSQVNRHLGDRTLPEDFLRLLQEVSKTYNQIEEEATKNALHAQRYQQLDLHFKTCQRIAHVGSWEYNLLTEDMENQPLFWSAETYRVLGKPPGSIPATYKSFLEAVHPDDVSSVKSAFERSVRTGKQYKVHCRIQWAEDDEKLVHLLGEVIYNSAGQPERIIGIIQDITVLHRTRTSLQQANDDLETLFRNIQEVVFSVDMQTNRLFQISAACEKVYGYTVEEFLSNPDLWFSLIVEEDRQTIHENDAVLRSGRAVDEEYRIRHKNGDIRWLESRIDPTLNEEGELVRLDGITLDITERKHYEEALEASNEELRKSNNELDRFVYSVSHDLRAPLASMLGAIDYSMTETTDKEVHYYLGLIRKTAVKLDIFIQDILDYSRNARTEIKKEKVDFNTIVSELSNNLKFMSTAKNNVDIKIRIKGDAPFYSDSSRVNIILNNLISNAVRYRDPNVPDPFVEVRVHQTTTSAMLDIIDNGIGINPKFHDKVFDMFFRVSKLSEGSGLGLYIVKEAVDKLNGTVTMESAPGKGTRFHIVLPNLVN